MRSWVFEPGHTAAEFSARHMMVANVRGHFKNVEGRVDFDPADPTYGSVEVRIDARGLWSGEPDRDAHLKSEDFLFVEKHPLITYHGDRVHPLGGNDFRVTGDLTIRGITRQVPLDVRYLGMWETPFWEGDRDRGPVQRIGFVAHTSIDRHDFNVSWNGSLDRGGVVVSDIVRIVIDVEALDADFMKAR